MAAHTLYLDPETWDLTLDPAGNIATATGAYAIAQSVANAIRLFTNDAYYDSDRGIPHFALELKTHPAISVLRARIKEAAERVEGVKDAKVTDLNLDHRTLTGVIKLTLNDGSITNVDF